MRARLSLTVIGACVLSACSFHLPFWHSGPPKSPDNEPTIKTLASRSVSIEADQRVPGSQDRAIAAYRSFLDNSPGSAANMPLRAEAMRRIGDLEMERTDGNNAAGDPDFHAAIASYQAYLQTRPADPGNDRVLYQLARAEEQSGDSGAGLLTLKRLVRDYPQTAYSDEAQFRLGELLFAGSDYAAAEKAYATVLTSGATGRYYDRALYMQGWTRFKQGQLDAALQSFFGVLDLKLAGAQGEAGLESIPDLTRADRELLEDTFRVVSLALENLEGAESAGPYLTTPQRQAYAFRVYEQLGELYLKQERIKDAADAFGLFARLNPLDARAPLMQSRVIAIYAGNGFANLALQAKKDYVAQYGRSSAFRTANPEGWSKARDLVRQNLTELARYYHGSAQKSKSSADYAEAIHWYRAFLEAFPDDASAAENNFLLAELLFENGQFDQAGSEYEKTAYQYPANNRSADAGYAALLSYAAQIRSVGGAQLAALQKSSVDSALQFAQHFAGDPRSAAVLANAADQLYALKEYQQSAAVAQQILALQPAAPAGQRRVAWTVLAYTAFEAGSYAASEQAFGQALSLSASDAANRSELVERQAAAIYRQGEQARAGGDLQQAVAAFARVGSVAPDSPINATAQYDAAAALIALKSWEQAAVMLEDFRKRYPKNALTPEAGNKLAAVYLELGQSERAATELDAIAARTADPKRAGDLLWQAAELHDSAGVRSAAAKSYERYLTLAPALAPALEARYRLAGIARQDGNAKAALSLMKELMLAEQNGASARTDRTRYLGASAALALAEPVAVSYRNVALVEPLAKNLKLKKARMEDTLKALALATDYGVAEISTEATFKIAATYRDFGTSLLASQRPARLSKAEREQYDVLLEEQAYPFEEKAIEIHEINARRSADGIYDQWVQNSFAALRELKPARYGKTERREAGPQSGSLNQAGIAWREQGQFDKAAAAYQAAIAQDAGNGTAVLNLGVLYDLYLGDTARAMEMYTRYLGQTPEGDAEVSRWVTELKNRKPLPAGQKDTP